MKTYLLSLISFFCFFLISCNQEPRYEYSQKETEQFLEDILANAKVIIGDITEIEKQPTDEIYIITRYPLSESTLAEYKKNDNFYLKNKNNDISDFATYTFKDYVLTNEKGEKLKFEDNGRAIYLQEGGLWTYDNVVCQNLSIEIRLNKKYKILKGYIEIEFVMPNNIFVNAKKQVKIPVNISIDDKVTE